MTRSRSGILSFLVCIGGCVAPDSNEVMVFAAASLTDVAEAFAEAYEADHPGTVVTVSPGASSTLARQIEAGAPADVFLSADPVWANSLTTPDGASSSPVVLARNRLVVVGPPGAHPWASMDDVRTVTRLGVGDPQYVPVGRYAQEAFARHWDALSDTLIPLMDARAVLAAAESGAVDAAVVYASDTLVAPDLTVLLVIENSTHSPIEIVGILPRPGSEHGREWMDSLQGNGASATWRRFGFIAVTGHEP